MRLFFAGFLVLLSFRAITQNVALIKSIPFDNPAAVSIDMNGSIYVADSKGNLNQFDSVGKKINHFSPAQPATPTLIDASRTMNVFIFYRDLQKFSILNRFLSSPELIPINRELISFAYSVAPSLDNNLWIFDNQSFSLKKYDLSIQKVTIDVPLDLLLDSDNYNISHMKEYQNRIYLNDARNGVLVFDNLANYYTTLPYSTDYFNFISEELYFVKSNEIKFYNLYSGKERSIKLNGEREIKFALVSESKIIAFTDNDISFFNYK